MITAGWRPLDGTGSVDEMWPEESDEEQTMDKRLRLELLVEDLNWSDAGLQASADLRDAIETMVTVTRKLMPENAKPKYSVVKISKPRFRDNVWRHESAKRLLLATGWVQDSEGADNEPIIRCCGQRLTSRT